MLSMILMASRRLFRGENSDEELMERFRDGDTMAFEILLSRHERAIFNFIYRMIRDREKAQDLLQETFLRVIKNKQRYIPKARFTTWLYTIARNQCIDAFRKAKHRRHASLDQPYRGEPGGRSLMDKLPGKSEDALQRKEAQEITLRIEEALTHLSSEQREVFVMRQFRNLRFREIAEIVGVSENTIKSRMRYALEHLRLQLADYAAELPKSQVIPKRSPA